MARRAYEDFLHRRQDPALLEKAAGNEFTARVFPIPAKGDKHLVVSYSQELPSSSGNYILPLRGLPKIKAVSAVARVARADRATLVWDETTLAQTAWTPDRDFIVPVNAPLAAVASGDWLASRIAVPADGAADDKPTSLAILVDTSASRALGYAHQVEEVGAMIDALAERYGDVELAVAAFDQDVLEIYRGKAADWGADQTKALLARQPLGASSMAGAIAWAAGAGMKRVVVFGDGVVTAGAEGDALLASIKQLGGKGVERFDAVLSGGIRDVEAAKTWVSAGLARDGAVIDLGAGTTDVARRLGLAVRSDLAISVKGASWSWPERAFGVQPGDELVVYAKGKAAVQNATITIGQTSVEVTGMRTNGALLSRAAAQAEIARLERDLSRATDDKTRTKLRDAIVKKSVDARVLSSLTALLVLETEDDYVRFGIPRNALADILVVGPKGLVLEHRAKPVIIAQPIATDTATTGREKGKHDELKKELATADKTSLDQGEGLEELSRLDPANVQTESVAAGSASPGLRGGDANHDGRPSPVVAEPPPAPRPDRDADAVADAEDDAGDEAEEMQPMRRASRHESRRSEPMEQAPEEDDRSEEAERNAPPALTGKLASIMKLVKAGKTDDALLEAIAWRKAEPGDVLALIGLGEALEAAGDRALAARAYGSLIDLFPARADLRRFAGERLERLGDAGRELAIDTYRHAVEDRPDHLTGHRLLAMALVRAGRQGEAFAALVRGLGQDYPSDRFRGGERILRDDLGLVGAAWAAKDPAKKAEIAKHLAAAGASLATKPSLRFVLYWETDANDVDFHIRDAKRGHAWYSHKQLPSGGELYEDVTTGYGPECFTIEGTPKAAPYRLKIHYYSRGPMGYGMGVLEVMRHDGKGNLTFEHRPYIAMNDSAYVDLGSVE
jgi:thioredoxin-like negative regulator of GroEL